MKSSKPKILIVDDMPTNIRILGETLRQDYAVSIATNGPRALELAQMVPMPDLILLDIIMPEMDGYEVCRRLKQMESTRDIPVIFITSKGEEEDEWQGFEFGGVDYILKPFSLPVVTARVKTQVALKQQRDALVQMAQELSILNQTKNRFLGIAAHDLRSPLSGIRGLSEIILMDGMGQLGDELRETIDIIYNESDLMLDLVNDLLDVAVIESGEFKLELERTSLSTLLKNRLTIFNTLAAKKKMKVVTELEDVPAIDMDKNRIVQVINNLFGNAVKYSNPGTEIKLKLFPTGSHVVMEITDQGPGIKKEEQHRLFGAFEKAGSVPTGNDEKSTGLGLSIVKRIIDAHQGRISIQSDLGSGTKMVVHLPIPNI